jgi:SAM-dependent methyltransferase
MTTSHDDPTMSQHDPDAPGVDARQHSPSSERNRAPILDALQRLLPGHGTVVEVASGSGQHAAWFAAAQPGWQWWPTDLQDDALASIDAWCTGLLNVQPARLLDVTRPLRPTLPASVDAVYCANMLHIAPWEACAGLMRLAADLLAPHGRLLLYGPYLVDDEPTAPSNLAFDADLRRRDARWGLRRLGDVEAQAAHVGLRLQARVPMPANNLLLVLARQAEAGSDMPR